MNEILTRQEIETRFDSEWILIAGPEVDKHLNIVRGEVIAHSKNRDEVDAKAIALRLKHSAFLYTGSIPDDMVIIL